MYDPSGAIVAAPTFGLPESPGGERNWDYRFSWFRDVLTLIALLRAGSKAESERSFNWVFDAVGGAPGQVQIMYGIRGERSLTEVELPWLEGHEGARPVRIGNGAYKQIQLDMVGEFGMLIVCDASSTRQVSPMCRNHQAAANRVARSGPDGQGIWEVRGPARPFTASKIGPGPRSTAGSA